MKFEVRCECGKTFAISPSDAGAVFDCSCGKPVKIPPLHLLRSTTGQSTKSPLQEIRAVLPTGLLPGVRNCTVCGAVPPPHSRVPHTRVKIVCERVLNEEGLKSVGRAAGGFLGSLLLVLFGHLSQKHKARSDQDILYDEEAVIVPLPICSNCRPQCEQEAVLRKALLQIPDYANLLEHYSEAVFYIV